MGKILRFQTKDNEALDVLWSQIENILNKQSGLAIRIEDDSIELHISAELDYVSTLGLLELFKAQLSTL